MSLLLLLLMLLFVWLMLLLISSRKMTVPLTIGRRGGRRGRAVLLCSSSTTTCCLKRHILSHIKPYYAVSRAKVCPSSIVAMAGGGSNSPVFTSTIRFTFRGEGWPPKNISTDKKMIQIFYASEDERRRQPPCQCPSSCDNKRLAFKS